LRVFAEVAQVLMRRARRLGQTEPAGSLAAKVFEYDATLVDVSLALCPCAHQQQSQAAVRLNVLHDTQLEVPAFASISGGGTHTRSGPSTRFRCTRKPFTSWIGATLIFVCLHTDA